MAQSHVFKTVDDAVSRLKRYRYKKTPTRTKDEIVRATAGNTFRAFRNNGYSPSGDTGTLEMGYRDAGNKVSCRRSPYERLGTLEWG